MTTVVTAVLLATAFIVHQHSTRPPNGLGLRLARALEYAKVGAAVLVIAGVLLAPLVGGGRPAPAAPPSPARSGGAR